MDYKIELKTLKVYEGMSEETNCFKGDIFINGKKVGYSKNDGRGGNSEIHGYTKEDNTLLDEVDKWCKKNPIPIVGYDFSMDSLEDRINDIVEKELISRDKKKLERKLGKSMLTKLIFTKQKVTEELTEYYEMGWKGHTIESMTKNPKGVEMLVKTINKELENGFRLLNTNLPENILK